MKQNSSFPGLCGMVELTQKQCIWLIPAADLKWPLSPNPDLEKKKATYFFLNTAFLCQLNKQNNTLRQKPLHLI